MPLIQVWIILDINGYGCGMCGKGAKIHEVEYCITCIISCLIMESWVRNFHVNNFWLSICMIGCWILQDFDPYLWYGRILIHVYLMILYDDTMDWMNVWTLLYSVIVRCLVQHDLCVPMVFLFSSWSVHESHNSVCVSWVIYMLIRNGLRLKLYDSCVCFC